jgi:hypothetical protein
MNRTCHLGPFLETPLYFEALVSFTDFFFPAVDDYTKTLVLLPSEGVVLSICDISSLRHE